jgi:molybdopterin-binding protein
MSADVTVTARSYTSPTVRGEGIRVVYRRRTAVDVPNVELPGGRTYGLLGASGAGKSTLLRVLGLLEPPSEGRVYIDDVLASRNDLATQRTIAAVFQKPYLLRATVGANVAYGLKLRRTPEREQVRRVRTALERVGLGGWEDRSALTLSGGEAQRVALARALVIEPRILLLDEPLSYMDPLLKRSLTLEFARILEGEHVTALYVTHDREEAAVVADRIGIMRDGRLVAEGDAETVLTLPTDEWVASFLGAQQPIEGVVERSDRGVMTIDCGGVRLSATGDLPSGTRVLLGIPPEDVLLFEPDVEFPRMLARNRVDGVVIALEPTGTTVRVTVAAGDVRLASSVSRASALDFGLAVGSRVTLLFKATALRVRRRDDVGVDRGSSTPTHYSHLSK